MLKHGFECAIRQFLHSGLVPCESDLAFLGQQKVWEDLLDSKKASLSHFPPPTLVLSLYHLFLYSFCKLPSKEINFSGLVSFCTNFAKFQVKK